VNIPEILHCILHSDLFIYNYFADFGLPFYTVRIKTSEAHTGNIFINTAAGRQGTNYHLFKGTINVKYDMQSYMIELVTNNINTEITRLMDTVGTYEIPFKNLE
jgi:hypothetical protein